MKTVEVVIQIPKEYMDKQHVFITQDRVRLISAIQNGTVLPKEHGDLKDTSKILEKAWIYNTDTDSYSAVYAEDIIDAPAVIKADRGDTDGNS